MKKTILTIAVLLMTVTVYGQANKAQDIMKTLFHG